MDLMQYYYHEEDTNSIPINIVHTSEFKSWKKKQSQHLKNWIETSQFKAKPNNVLCVPNDDGKLSHVIVIVDDEEFAWALGNCVKQLPAGSYHLANNHEIPDEIYLGWGLGAYQFNRYKQNKVQLCKLYVGKGVDSNKLSALLCATKTARDMVNTPASDMMPQNISKQCKLLVKMSNASLIEYVGDELIKENYPVIHAVGRASIHLPRLIEVLWGDKKYPRVCLIGKGVSFDSGGLNIKPAQGMRLMKKDMGGAAHVLGIAQAIMKLNMPISLQVLIPTVENAISGDAFRPGDILKSRSGKTIEIDNTDAEGRLILCDAISKAAEADPDLIIDFATLTGAARVALGTEIPAFFTNDDALAESLMHSAKSVSDPIWQLPLHKPYRYMLDSNVADMCNSSASGFAGAITAALFLQEFVPVETKWVHFDVMAWNLRSRAGRPEGGEAMGMRAVIEFLQQRYRTSH